MKGEGRLRDSNFKAITSSQQAWACANGVDPGSAGANVRPLAARRPRQVLPIRRRRTCLRIRQRKIEVFEDQVRVAVSTDGCFCRDLDGYDGLPADLGRIVRRSGTGGDGRGDGRRRSTVLVTHTFQCKEQILRVEFAVHVPVAVTVNRVAGDSVFEFVDLEQQIKSFESKTPSKSTSPMLVPITFSTR